MTDPATSPERRAAARALVIGTRGSPLALTQANMVRAGLEAAHPGLAVSLAVIRTSGDRVTDRPLAQMGGKGLFTKEIEDALLAGTADLAVHSMKDVPTALPPGLVIPCMLAREDPRDVLIARDPAVRRLTDLPHGAAIGTASLRRAAQALSLRPDLRVVPLRGNVGTRIAKIEGGAADATFLALAGLKRLGMAEVARCVLEPDEMLPAVAQGAIGIECRANDARVLGLLAPLDHAATRVRVAAERALLAVLEGSCRTPIAALAILDNSSGDGSGRFHLRAMIAAPDGSRRFDAVREGAAADAEALGADAGRELRAKAGPAFIAGLAGNS